MPSVEFYCLFGRIYCLRLQNGSIEKQGTLVNLHWYLCPKSLNSVILRVLDDCFQEKRMVKLARSSNCVFLSIKSVLLKYTHLEQVTTHSHTPARPGPHCNSGTNCSPSTEQVKDKKEACRRKHQQHSHQTIIPYTYKAMRRDNSFNTETRLRATSPRKRV